jgi:hypothetical protein
MKLTKAQAKAIYNAILFNEGKISASVDHRVKVALLNKNFARYGKGKDDERIRFRVTESGYEADLEQCEGLKRAQLVQIWRANNGGQEIENND